MHIQSIGAKFGNLKKANLEKLISDKNLSAEDLKKSLEDVSKLIEKKTHATRAVTNVAAAGLGVGTALAASKLYTAKTGKPAGVPASLAHIVTNDKLDNKAAVIAEQSKEGVKDLLTIGGVTLGTAATGTLVAGSSNKAAAVLKNMKTKIAGVLDDIIINSNGKSVKEIIKGSKQFVKFNTLPMPAKVGVIAGAAAFAIITPLVMLISSQKAGYIEGKHEVN